MIRVGVSVGNAVGGTSILNICIHVLLCVLIYFINFMYDITYIGLHVHSLYHNAMCLLVYSLCAHLYISSSMFYVYCICIVLN